MGSPELIRDIQRPLGIDSIAPMIKDMLWADPVTSILVFGGPALGQATVFGDVAVKSSLYASNVRRPVYPRSAIQRMEGVL